MVVPKANVEPDACEYVIVTGPTASVAVAAAYFTTAPFALVACTVRLPLIEVIVGGVRSTTVTVNVAVVLLPAPSFAVTVTVVVPSANVDPEALE